MTQGLGRHVEKVHENMAEIGLKGAGETALAPAQSQIEDAWVSVRAGLRRDIGARLYDQWIRTLSLGAFCPVSGTLDMESPSDFSANYVSGNFTPRLCLAWRAARSRALKVMVSFARIAATNSIMNRSADI